MARSGEKLSVRFWRFVRRSHGCWGWDGAKTDRGYGRIRGGAGRKILRAHRVSWELHYGPIPDGMNVNHTCDNRHCCNPEHLYIGTQQENMRDKAERGRARNGHTAKVFGYV